MEVESVFVTGANRGIGLEFVRQLARLPKPPRFIFATYRSANSLEELTEIKNSSKDSEIVLIKMDVTKPEDATEARKSVEKAVGENGLTLLINNAGLSIDDPFPGITEESLLKHFRTNTVGPVRLLQELFPLLQKAASRNPSSTMQVSRAAVLNLSSMAGSITRTGVDLNPVIDVLNPGYKTSKAALNMAMRTISANVKNDGILIILMCPGWVKTDMGTEEGEITEEESVSAMLKTLANLNESHHGSYMDRFSNPYPF